MQLDLFLPRRKIYISKTDFVNIIMCPYTWVLKKVERVKTIQTENMTKGYNLHEIMKRLNREFKTIREAKEFILERQKCNPDIEDELENIINFLERRTKEGLEVFPMHSELNIQLTKGDYIFNGIIDAVYQSESGVEVFEYKNSFYKEDDELFLETSFYSYIFSGRTNKKISKMGIFSFKTGETKYFEFNKDFISSKIEESIKIVREENFEPKPSEKNCKFCVFRKTCRYSLYI